MTILIQLHIFYLEIHLPCQKSILTPLLLQMNQLVLVDFSFHFIYNHILIWEFRNKIPNHFQILYHFSHSNFSKIMKLTLTLILLGHF